MGDIPTEGHGIWFELLATKHLLTRARGYKEVIAEDVECNEREPAKII